MDLDLVEGNLQGKITDSPWNIIQCWYNICSFRNRRYRLSVTCLDAGHAEELAYDTEQGIVLPL